MATIKIIVTDIGIRSKDVVWDNLTETNNVGEAFEYPECSDVTMEIQISAGAGPVVVLEGSNSLTSFFTLTDYDGAALSFTATGMKSVKQRPRYIRPRVSAGTGVVAKVTLLAVRTVH
jgi:hypothetical protein